MESKRPPRPILQNCPGHVVKPSKRGWTVRWHARTDLIRLGFTPKSVQIWKGYELTDEARRHVLEECHRHQAEMLAFSKRHRPVLPEREDRWTDKQDALVIALNTDDAFEALGGRRTKKAIMQRRYKLTHSADFRRPAAMNTGPYSPEEVALLRKHYPVVTNLRDLLPLFPDRTFVQLYYKARRMKLKRKHMGDVKLAMNGLFNLVDEIRMKVKETGMTFRAFDQEIGTGQYFSKYCTLCRKVNLTAVAKALVFFGAVPTIDWCER
jgi:hypothetical protein